MTTQTETPEVPKGDAKAPQAPGRGSSLLAGFIASLAIYAGLVWVAGIALNRGFGVHVPFVAGWLLLMTGGWLVKHLATNVAQVWHNARVLADIDLMAATMAVHEAAQAKTFLDMDRRVRAAEKDAGAYL
jgi:hypothetical protein